MSGDAVLACFIEMPWSGIGYVLSLAEGTLRFITKMGPIQETTMLGGGAFLVQYHGYGTCEALRYERDGNPQTAAGNALSFDAARDLAMRVELCAADDRLLCTAIATAEESKYFAFFSTNGPKSWQLVRVDNWTLNLRRQLCNTPTPPTHSLREQHHHLS